MGGRKLQEACAADRPTSRLIRPAPSPITTAIKVRLAMVIHRTFAMFSSVLMEWIRLPSALPLHVA